MFAITGFSGLIALPVMSNLSAKAVDLSAKRNAQMLASAAFAARATGDPVFRSLRSKAAVIDYLTSDESGSEAKKPAIDVEGITAEEAFQAARHLTYVRDQGGLNFSASPVRATDNELDEGGPSSEDEERDRWNAQLLEGAATLALGKSGPGPKAVRNKNAVRDKKSAIIHLVDGGAGGPLVARLSRHDQEGAAEHLDYTGEGKLIFTPSS